MTRIAVVMLVAGCWGSSAPPATPPSNAPPPELRCKTAIEQASAGIDLRDSDVTMAVGECERRDWPRPARECIAAAHTSDALVACSASYNLGKRGIFANKLSAEAALNLMGEFRDKMCACKDTSCAQRVSDEMAKWAQDQARDGEEPPHMSDDDVKRATKIGEEMGKCMQAAMSAGSTP